MTDWIAILILTALPLLGVLFYKRRIDGLFSPRSPFLQTALIMILLILVAVSLGGLVFRGWWNDFLPWCGLLLVLYVWSRGLFLLLHATGPSET